MINKQSNGNDCVVNNPVFVLVVFDLDTHISAYEYRICGLLDFGIKSVLIAAKTSAFPYMDQNGLSHLPFVVQEVLTNPV